MLFDLYTKDEGNPFTTKIWVVGSYTDTLLKTWILLKLLNFKIY